MDADRKENGFAAHEPPNWKRMLGPFYLADGVAKVGRISPHEVVLLTDTGHLLALPTTQAIPVFPAFQFDARNFLLPHLPEVLQVLPSDDPWGTAAWLLGSSCRFDPPGRAYEILRTEKFEQVLIAARQDAYGWSH